MAPDLNSLNTNGQWDYSTPGSTGYEVPDIVYNVRLCNNFVYHNYAHDALRTLRLGS
jgi:hypothetical protein